MIQKVTRIVQNMQMKIIVESKKDFEKWINEQQTFSEIIQ